MSFTILSAVSKEDLANLLVQLNSYEEIVELIVELNRAAADTVFTEMLIEAVYKIEEV